MRDVDVLPAEGHPTYAYDHDRLDRGDVIPWNVLHCREVRLSPSAPLCSAALLPALDRHWNVRPDGSTAGLSGRVSGVDSHCTVDDAPPGGGALETQVLPWLRARLAAPLPTGAFDGGQRIAVRAGDQPRGLLTADVDSDGLQDVIVPLLGSAEVAVFHGALSPGGPFDETGGLLREAGKAAGGPDASQLSAPRFVPIGVYADHVIAADFDRDGRIDLAAASGDGDAVSVLYGTGGGAFTAPLLLTGWGDRPVRLAAVDLDADDYPDLVALGASCFLESVRNRVMGARAWGTYRSYGELLGGGDGLSLVAAEVTGDDLPDLVAGHITFGGEGALAVVPGTLLLPAAEVTFDAEAPLRVEGSSYLRPSDVLAVDLTSAGGEGPLDLVCLSDGFSYELALFEGRGDGTFEGDMATDGDVGDGPQMLAYGDFDFDGLIDIVRAAGTSIAIVRGGAAGFEQNIEYLHGPLVDGAAEHVAVADLDGDGRLDIVAAGSGDAGVTVFLGR